MAAVEVNCERALGLCFPCNQTCYRGQNEAEHVDVQIVVWHPWAKQKGMETNDRLRGEKRSTMLHMLFEGSRQRPVATPLHSPLSVPAKNTSFSGLRVAAFDLRATPGPVRQQWRQSSWRGAPVVGGAACGWAAAAGMNEQPSAERSALSVEQGPRIPSLFNPSRCTSAVNCHPLNPYTKHVYLHC